MKRKSKSRLSCCVARVPSAREARGLSTTKPGSRSPPARSLLLSLLSTLRSLSNNSLSILSELDVHSSPLRTKQKASLLSTLRSLSNNTHNNSCSHRLLSLFRVHTRAFDERGTASFSRPPPLLGVPPPSLPIGRADTPPARQRDRSGIFYIRRENLGVILFRHLTGEKHSCSPSAVLAGNRAVLAPCTPSRSSCPDGAVGYGGVV